MSDKDEVQYTPVAPDGSDRIQVVDLAENRFVLLLGYDNKARMFVHPLQAKLVVALLRRIANAIESGDIRNVGNNN